LVDWYALMGGGWVLQFGNDFSTLCLRFCATLAAIRRSSFVQTMSLRTRLLLSYLLIVVVFMCIIGLVLLLLASSVQRTVVFQQLDAAADATMLVISRLPRFSQLALERIAERRDVRVIVTDDAGNVLQDSEDAARRWNLWKRAGEVQRDPDPRGEWQDDAGQTWLFVARRWIPSQDAAQPRQLWVFFTMRQPQPRQWFGENLANPLLLAGGITLALSAVLAWLISRSVARPLQRVSDAAHAIAQGDYAQTAPPSGPPEVRRLAQDFNHMAQQVRASRDAQRDFVANVSHELKTPLTSIQGYSQAILDGTAADPETVHRSATIIHDEAGRMARMATELLDLARIESGQIAMRREPVDIGTLLENVVERFRLRAEGAQISLTAQFMGLPSVSGDGDRLAQVFNNLLDNALKHTPPGGKVTLTAQQLTPSGVRRRGKDWPHAVEVSVSDSGAGIPPEDLSRVFERFYQVDKSRRHTGSIGLGLAITREIVEAHGGSIKAESILGLGTRFTVALPVGAS